MYKPGKSGLFIVISVTVLTFFVVVSFGCKVAPKNACEISNDDAAVFFGNVKLFASDKSNLLIEEGKNDPNVRSCSFRTDEHIGVPSLRWTSIEGKTEQEAKENFDRVRNAGKG